MDLSVANPEHRISNPGCSHVEIIGMNFSCCLSPVMILGLCCATALAAEPDVLRGQQAFGACVACHSLTPDKNLTGPSLSGVWGRKAGGLASFERYSDAMKSANITWESGALDLWLADPKNYIPGNRMTFAGIADAQTRADIIAFLKKASAGDIGNQFGMDKMMEVGEAPNLKALPPGSQVQAITYCRDTYRVTLKSGETGAFWERNLRFKTDSGPEGPVPGVPAIVGAGMMGDRASVIFAAPEEFGTFIKRKC
jgi:cytochrome c